MIEISYHPLNPINPFFYERDKHVSLEEFLRKDNS